MTSVSLRSPQTNVFKKSLIGFILLYSISIIMEGANGQHCSYDCQRGIDEAKSQARDYNAKLTRVTDDLNQRLRKLENQQKGVIAEVNALSGKVNNLDHHLQRNITNLSRRMDEEITILSREVRDQINSLRSDLTRRMEALEREVRGGHHHHTTTPREVYLNLTSRIDSLENGRIHNLTLDNSLWRRNFRSINSTFEKLRRCNC